MTETAGVEIIGYDRDGSIDEDKVIFREVSFNDGEIIKGDEKTQRLYYTSTRAYLKHKGEQILI